MAEAENAGGKSKRGNASKPSGQATAPAIVQDTANRLVTMSDAAGNLVLRLNIDGRCLLDRVIVRGREVVVPETGVCSAIQVSNQWFTTRSGMPPPRNEIAQNQVTVSEILYGGGGVQVNETWTFIVQNDRIDWQIDRKYFRRQAG